MKSSDWFIVGLRLFGVWLLLDCLNEAALGAERHFRMASTQLVSESAYWFHAGVDSIVGLALLTCGPYLASLLHWERLPEHPCQKCGYDLRAAKDRCPECGTEITPAEAGKGD